MLRPLLRDDQWDRIKGLLAGKRGDPGARAGDNRLFVEAVLVDRAHGCALARPSEGVREMVQCVHAFLPPDEKRCLETDC